MKALQFGFSIPRYLLGKVLGHRFPRILWSRFASLQYTDAPEPQLPWGEWVKIAVHLGGICGSDLHLLFLDDSPSLSPFASFPFIPGHEIVGTVVEVGPEAGEIKPGERVAVDPLLPCAARGLELCQACSRGDFNLCTRFTDGRLSPGILIGGCRDTGGGWGPYVVAHKSQVLKVPPTVTDENAVMVDPLAISIHAVVRHPPGDADTVLVIGGGVIGICVIAALRALGFRGRIVVLAKYPYQAKTAQAYGANETILLQRGDGHYDALADVLGGRLLQPVLGKRVVVGGADVTYECVGTGRSIDDALRLTRSRGKVVLVGLAAIPKGVDWTFIWLHELQVLGTINGALETLQGQRQKAHEIALDLLAQGKVDLSPLVTHRFPLDAYPEAFSTATGKSRNRVFKVVFQHVHA
ncbi:MAG: alcohol dehydrogenase catalytic domain-containing protein [Armatimonadota bacterium]|nr:alcohol dehydrogenase catalytic domain-containing protein [Armatimonadota bacterium]MDR5704247.1 alcohol dehydrogenase catalytic domain-containing protein [Armatimonadota bacterium]